MKTMTDSFSPRKAAERAEISRQTQEYLARGGLIDRIPAGVLSESFREAIRAEYRERALKATKARWG